MIVLKVRPRTVAIWAVVTAWIMLVAAGTAFRSGLPGQREWLRVLVPVTVERQLPIYGVRTDEPRLALSFDATWGAEHTASILETLDEHEITTTFFLVTIWVEDYPEMVEEIQRRGHEIGLHSTTHPHMTQLSRAQIKEELEQNWQSVHELTGQEPDLFRPPYGAYNNRLLSAAEELGLFTIQWSVDSLDWMEGQTRQGIVERVVGQAHPGAIILMHNNAQHTAAALPQILAALHERGYDVVPISQLIYRDNYTIDHQGMQVPRP